MCSLTRVFILIFSSLMLTTCAVTWPTQRCSMAERLTARNLSLTFVITVEAKYDNNPQHGT